MHESQPQKRLTSSVLQIERLSGTSWENIEIEEGAGPPNVEDHSNDESSELP